jgi:very-short-patch-repair endonuclease
VDSEFEADVAEALRAQGVDVRHQYPACGFSIDLLCELDGERLAVECDGEFVHLDEHGNLRIEDIERQAILERAGWSVLRIAYRKWRADPASQVGRVIDALHELAAEDEDDEDDPPTGDAPLRARPLPPPPSASGKAYSVSAYQGAIVQAMRADNRDTEAVLRAARIALGYSRLGPRIREGLLLASRQLSQMGLIAVEDGEYFLTPEGRAAQLHVQAVVKPQRSRSGYRKRASASNYRRRSGYRSRGYRRY